MEVKIKPSRGVLTTRRKSWYLSGMTKHPETKRVVFYEKNC